MAKINFDETHHCPDCNGDMEVSMPIWITPGTEHIDTSKVDYELGNPQLSNHWWCSICQENKFPREMGGN